FSRRKLDLDHYRPLEDIEKYKDEIDLLILCGSSDKDILSQGPELLKNFNTLDSFDNHGKIKDYYEKMEKIGKHKCKLALISTGMDPSIFSLTSTIGQAIPPAGESFTLWGRRASPRHSSAGRSAQTRLQPTHDTATKREMLSTITT